MSGSDTYLTITKEVPGSDGKMTLPGHPIARVHSNLPELATSFLCVVQPSTGPSERDKRAANDAFRRGREEHSRQLAMCGKRLRVSEVESLHRAIDEVEEESEDVDRLHSNAAIGRIAGQAASWDYDEDAADAKSVDDSEGRPRFVKLPLGSWFEPLPAYRVKDPDAVKSEYRQSSYVAGPAGCGKTIYVATQIKAYKKIWPDNPVFGICKTRMEDDRGYKGLGVKQLSVEALRKTKKGKIDLKDMFGNAGCLIVFDDWDSFDKGTDRAYVLALMQDALNLGRKLLISVMVTSHQLTNYLETRPIIAEAESVTLFPRDTMRAAMSYMATKIGLSKEIVARLPKKGRWVTCHKTNPMYLLSETEAELL